MTQELGEMIDGRDVSKEKGEILKNALDIYANMVRGLISEAGKGIKGQFEIVGKQFQELKNMIQKAKEKKE